MVLPVLISLYAFIAFQQPVNLIKDEWFCDTQEMTGLAYVVNDNKTLKQVINDNAIVCSETGAFARNIDFKKYTLLNMQMQPGNYCSINYYRRVVFDKQSGCMVYTIIANGVGLCKQPVIATAQFVLVPKLKKGQLVKFRFDYVASEYGKELSKAAVDKKLTAGDDKFARVIVI